MPLAQEDFGTAFAHFASFPHNWQQNPLTKAATLITLAIRWLNNQLCGT
jgi:hypothetical protein